MARENRTTRSDLEAELQANAVGFDFFQALRLVECANRELPRLGKSRLPKDDPIRLGQEPHLAFPPSSLAAYTPGARGQPARLAVLLMGLFGPMGPLPLHLTAYALTRRDLEKDHTFTAFCDVFHHRLLSLFYRAWADARPHLHHDRPETSRFELYLGALFGHGLPSLRWSDGPLQAAKLRHAGLLACHPCHPDQLATVLRNFFEMPVLIEEFVGGWLDLPPALRSRLGQGARAPRLASDVVVGTRSFQRQHRFRVRAGPLDLERFTRLLPGGRWLDQLRSLVRLVVGDELEWDVNLVLKASDVPDARLDGRAALGWTSWLTTGLRTQDADDLVLKPVAVMA